jgi:hypothetical protein
LTWRGGFDRVAQVNLRGPSIFAWKVARGDDMDKGTNQGLQAFNNVRDIILAYTSLPPALSFAYQKQVSAWLHRFLLTG